MENEIIFEVNAKGHVLFLNNEGILTITSDCNKLKEYKIPVFKSLIKNDQIRGRNIKALGEDFGYTYYIGWDKLNPLPYDKFKDAVNEIVKFISINKLIDDEDSHLRAILRMACIKVLIL